LFITSALFTCRGRGLSGGHLTSVHSFFAHKCGFPAAGPRRDLFLSLRRFRAPLLSLPKRSTWFRDRQRRENPEDIRGHLL
jgi:hypothetical protein